MKKRSYAKVKRAVQEKETRNRIVVAAMKLHEKMGPAQTSIKAVAERAGVQRLTVYRHFPNEVQLFKACTDHWFILNPPPDPEEWQKESNPEAQACRALQAFYRYYDRTERMWSLAYRDLEQVKAIQNPMEEFEAFLDKVARNLVSAWSQRVKAKKDLRATLRHGLRFSTWQSLKKEKLSTKQMAELVLMWAKGIK